MANSYFFQYHKLWGCCWKIYWNNGILVLFNVICISLNCNVVMLCPWKCSILETVNELSLENQGRSPLIIILSEKLFTIHILMAPNKHECLWACYPYHRSFFLVNPDPLPERRRRERGFIQRYYETLFGILNPQVSYWSFFESLFPLWMLCLHVFLGTFCLNPHFLNTVNVSIIFFYCGFFSIIISSVQLVLWSNHSLLLLFFTKYFVFILYSVCSDICGRLPLFGLSFNPSIYIPSSHHIYLFNHWQAQLLYFYESLWLRGLQPYHGIQH